MSGKIYAKTFGKNTYYHYHKYRIEKINPEDKGKTKNTGKSKVITEVEYLGKAKDVLAKVREANMEGKAKSVEEREFGLQIALYNAVEKIKLVNTINRHIEKKREARMQEKKDYPLERQYYLHQSRT